ncbi:MAG TPA: histidine triad nucleotide-binding protein [Jatrophihabitantaceae bacterium]|jgi:histidine triad (HIT) family protein
MVDPDCIFCKIVAGDIPATRVYEDENTIAFRDTNPQAPTHVLVVPREHFTDLGDIARDPAASAGFVAGIRGTAETLGVEEYRTVCNTGAGVGQSVFHLHAHVLAGRPMGWPPG